MLKCSLIRACVSFDDCRVKSELSKTKVSEEDFDDVPFVLFTVNDLELILPESVTSATVLKSFTISVTLPSWVRRGSVDPVNAQREAIARLDFPTPLLWSIKYEMRK